ncbi:MAG: hypothetical protein RR444_02670 [Oscillospiraceae bacterium]
MKLNHLSLILKNKNFHKITITYVVMLIVIITIAKQYPDVVESLEIESKYTNINICFDISHYFTPLVYYMEYMPGYKGYTNWKQFTCEYVTSQYAKRYMEEYKEYSKLGLQYKNAPDIAKNTGLAKPYPKYSQTSSTPRYNTTDFIKTTVAPTVEGGIRYHEWSRFKKFKAVDKTVPEYAVMHDEDNLYIAVNTKDKTINVNPLNFWYQAKGDMLQLFVSPQGERILNAELIVKTEHAARIVLVRTDDNTYGAKIISAGKKVNQNCDFNYTYGYDKDGYMTMMLRFGLKNFFGMEEPIKDRDKFGLEMVCYDNGVSASSSKTKDGLINNDEMLVFYDEGEEWFDTNIPANMIPKDTGISKFDTLDAVKTDKVPTFTGSIITSEWNKFKPFIGEAEVKPEYSIMYDDENLYMAIKTNDTTVKTGKPADWWKAESDMLQLVFSSKDEKIAGAESIPDTNHTVRMSLTRTTESEFAPQFHANGKLINTERGFSYSIGIDKKGCPTIMMRFSFKYFFGEQSSIEANRKMYYNSIYYNNGISFGAISKEINLGENNTIILN